MMEGREYQQKFCRPRFRSYQPVICELLRRGDMDGVMKLWKHMQWQNILPKVFISRYISRFFCQVFFASIYASFICQCIHASFICQCILASFFSSIYMPVYGRPGGGTWDGVMKLWTHMRWQNMIRNGGHCMGACVRARVRACLLLCEGGRVLQYASVWVSAAM